MPRDSLRRRIVVTSLVVLTACGKEVLNDNGVDAPWDSRSGSDANSMVDEDGSSATESSSDTIEPPPVDAGGYADTTAGMDDTGAESDAMAPASCDLNTPFGMPRPIVELNTLDDEAYARLSADGLTVYFVRGSNGTTNYRRLFAVRPDVQATFGDPKPVRDRSSIPTTFEGKHSASRRTD